MRFFRPPTTRGSRRTRRPARAHLAGIEQARRLRELLAGEEIELGVATELRRTQETLELALDGRDVPRIVCRAERDPLRGFDGGLLAANGRAPRRRGSAPGGEQGAWSNSLRRRPAALACGRRRAPTSSATRSRFGTSSTR